MESTLTRSFLGYEAFYGRVEVRRVGRFALKSLNSGEQFIPWYCIAFLAGSGVSEI